ncbi:Hypp7131 [Branchiostoma lanceolatum]|uniref:Hypp7131 protein n=1 Tax=Branchiostoma lanceolatum TaxID=7740 RepID=A0A8J9YXU2_BRALA|nr:Hypp7131 [Branchiostoma lanceolatum]
MEIITMLYVLSRRSFTAPRYILYRYRCRKSGWQSRRTQYIFHCSFPTIRKYQIYIFKAKMPPKANPDHYTTWKTSAEALIDVSLFASNVTLILTITRSPNGSNTGEEIAKMVLVCICMVLQVGLMVLFVYQSSRNIEDLGTDDAGKKEDRNLDRTNAAANIMAAFIMLFEIVILAFVSENQNVSDDDPTISPIA